MFIDLFTQWLDNQLNYIATAYAENEGTDYKFRVTYNNDYKIDAEELQVHTIYGTEVKIEGDRYSRYLEFNAQVWSEKNSNGRYTQEIFNKLYEMYSKKAITIVDNDDVDASGTPTSYNVWVDFGTLVLMDSKVASGNSFRCKFGLNGKILYSCKSQIGKHTYITFVSNPTSNDWYEVDTINPTETRKCNNSVKATQSGAKVIDGVPVFSGSFGTILRNDALGTKLFNMLVGDDSTREFSIRYKLNNFDKILTNIKIDSISSSLDENTKIEVITIAYTKDITPQTTSDSEDD